MGEYDGENRSNPIRFPHYWGLGGLLFLLLALPLQARPQALVILADHLTLSDVMRPDLPNFVRMRREGRLALLSPGLAKKPDSVAAAYVSLGAGDSVGVGDKSQGLMDASLRQAGIRTALLGDADGDDTGPYRPALLFLPLPDVASDDGTVADPLVPGGKREDPARLWAATQTALKSCDLVTVCFGDFDRAECENRRGFLLPTVYRKHRERALSALDRYLGLVIDGFHGPVYVVVPTPALLPDGSWNSLTPFLALNTGTSNSLTSDTTQTPGLVAARDLAPTLLSVLQVSIPLQMTGAPVHSASVPPAALAGLDRLVRLNQEAQDAIFWAVGLVAGTIVFSGLTLYLSGRMTGRAGSLARYGLRVLSAWPLALLLAPLAGPRTVSQYLLEIAAAVGLLALLPSPAVLFSVTALVLSLDGLTGTPLVSNSALSEYALSGIRFYGIGNEYMGVLIGGALLMTTLTPTPRPSLHPATEALQVGAASGRGESEGTEPDETGMSVIRSDSPLPVRGRGGGWGLPLWFAFVTFVLSFPAFGAKAGGAVTAAAAFVIAWRLLRHRPVRWTHLLGSIALGFALVFLWAILSHVLHLRRTHLETAADALGQGRFGYIAGVSLRKIGLAVRVALHPGTLLGLLAFAALGLAIRKLLWRQVTAYLSSRPCETAILKAGLWSCLVALLFNDSGIVAAILILQCLALLLLHGLYSNLSDAREGGELHF